MATAKKTGGVTLDDFASEFIKAPGFGECLLLCDVQELERICDMIPEAFAAGRHGQAEAYGLHISLIKCLRDPVSRYVEELHKWEHEHSEKRKAKLEKLNGGPVRVGPSIRIETEPSVDFIECIEQVAERIEFGPWSDEDAYICADRLRRAWYKWIACLSSYWMWAQVPRLLSRKPLGKHIGNMPAKDGKRGRGRKADHAALLEKFEQGLSKGTNQAVLHRILANEYGYEVIHVRRLTKPIREKHKQKP